MNTYSFKFKMMLSFLLSIFFQSFGQEKELIASVPIHFYGKHILLKVSVNNHTDEWFIFDSGASHNMIDGEYAKKIGLSITDSTWVAGFSGKQRTCESKGNSIRVGDSQTDDMAFTFVHNLDPSGYIKGYLGGSFLRKNVVSIDYQKRLLSVYDMNTFKYKGNGMQLYADHSVGVPAIKTTLYLEGDTLLNGWYFVDTGASASVICNPWVEKEFNCSLRFKEVKKINLQGYGGGFKTLQGQCDSLSLGNFVLRKVPVQMQVTDAPVSPSTHSYHGFIGADVLMRFKIYFDYLRLRLILEPKVVVKS